MGAPTSVIVTNTPPQPAAAGFERGAPRAAEDPSIAAAWGEDGLTFGDLLDLINPLQHLPVISTLYRKFTGDEIAPAARLLGGGLFGGPLGVASAAVGVAVEATTGKDLGEHVLTLFDGPEEAPATAIAWAGPRVGAVALADPEAAPTAAIAWAGPRVGAVALADPQPEPATAIAWAGPRTAPVVPGDPQPAPDDGLAKGAIAPEPAAVDARLALAADQAGLVPIEPLLAHVALRAGDAVASEGTPDGYRAIAGGAASDRLSAIELARILALYHRNARAIQQSQSAIASTL